uniref:FGFR1 oncogene partner (FOP) N-terminal dimerisation domain-containing protein n=1 Tax=Oncorhynchus mykiss TaxID=8022 RepID=A0A8L0DQR3_ONCMY
MSATENDTELRDLLIQTLENNGVLNKLKVQMRAAVFLAMDEQNKTPLVNENLKTCLNTEDGKPGLIIDFLQVFHIDFTLAVFQPEINSLNGLDSCEQVSHDLGITETDMNRTTPLLLELVKRGRHREKASIFSAVKTHQYTGLNILLTFIHLHTLAYSFALQRDSDISSCPNPKPSCGYNGPLSCSVPPLLSCSVPPLLSCSVPPLLSCSVPPLLSCSVPPLLSCSVPPLLS